MSGNSRNEVDQDIHSSSHSTENLNRVKSVAPSIDSVGAQQPRVDRSDNEGQGDSNTLCVIAYAL
ncbi:hypothetical protein PVK06_024390 [Gossypium arboreum]|uniref:Uncharacterized protein n=1 Tax=Gossypium arboreum TaxID=29729 RepID=A0ABR0PDU7_GOSAR|nr:hypothetical protein PVK06_024390 [Gossypium arboreum]